MSASIAGSEGGSGLSGRALLLNRLAIAVLQAAALYWLTLSVAEPPLWPASQPALFVPGLLAAIYLPLLAMLARGKLAVPPFLLWLACAGLVIAALGYHDVARMQAADTLPENIDMPRFQLWIALAIGLFVANALVTDSAIERRLQPSYTRHFDTAWKLGVQIVLAFVFVAVFWGVLELGAGLFRLIDIGAFQRLISRPWFVFPATTLALAVSIHVTDVQPALIRGARSLALSLFSWLTPLLALIILGFLSSLPFVSLQPLWRTHFATGLLLFVAIMLIFLINCCYQDGATEQTTSKTKRLAATLGAIEMVPLTALSALGLALRVGQYGWSVQRITAAAMVLVVSCYAIGYASAVWRSPSWLKRLEITNWLNAYLVLVLILALFSPLADPARLMVADQIARLESGAIKPEAFDFAALKFDGARWGAAALNDVRHGSLASDAAVQARIEQVLAASNRNQFQQSAPAPVPHDLADYVTVYPPGRTLPPSFLQPDFASRYGIGWNLCTQGDAKETHCFAHYTALSPGGAEAIVLVTAPWNGAVFEQDAQGEWRKTGVLNGPLTCLIRAMRSGPLRLEPHAAPDIVVDGQHFAILPASPTVQQCPADHSPANAATHPD